MQPVRKVDELVDAAVARAPARRLVDIAEVGRVVSFLVGGGASGMTGDTIYVDAGLHIVKSPIVGTFYGSPSPGAAPFVTPGDHVDKGQVIGIVEAMKLMNEIESDAAGEVVKCLVSNGQPIEFGQPLFSIRLS